MFPHLPVCATFVVDTNCVRDKKNVSDFVPKHFVSTTNVSQFVQHKKHLGQQCVCNNASSFTRAFTHGAERDCMEENDKTRRAF